MSDTIQHGGETWIRRDWYEQRGQELNDVTNELSTAQARIKELEAVVERLQPVVDEACVLVDADLYRHPMLDREQAVKCGVASLIQAVAQYRATQTASLNPGAKHDPL